MDNIVDRIKAQKPRDDCDFRTCVLCGKDSTHFYPHHLCFDHWNEWYDFKFGDEDGEENEEWANSLRDEEEK